MEALEKKKTATEEFLETYLKCLGIEKYEMEAKQDDIGYLIILKIPKTEKKIGVLKGKRGNNLIILKKMMRIIGFNERKYPFLVIKLI
jgi:hypothetical protein